LCRLCRRRHNRHYADPPVMPTRVENSLQIAQSLARDIGIIRRR
jgi:hypothetical protein